MNSEIKAKVEIKPGHQYQLDGKQTVTVIKAVNRAATIFSVEIPGIGIQMVEKDRLSVVILPI